MSEDSSASGATETTTSGEVQETQTTQEPKDVVSYDSHRKLLAEKKKLQAQHEEMMREFQSLKEEKLATEGNKDELIESLRTKSKSAEEKFNKAVNYFADRTVKAALREEALKAGCINVDDFIKLTDLSLIEVSDDFGVDMDHIKNVVLDAKKSRDYLFSAKAPNVKTGTPSKPQADDGDWRKLPPLEQAKYALSLGKKT